jgi:hypothetical protein
MEIFIRAGVSQERLQKYNHSTSYGPKVHNTWLDKDGYDSTEQLRDSHWNQELVFQLAKLLAQIVKDCPDRARFGNKHIEWQRLLQKRFGEIYRSIIKALPQKEEEEKNPGVLALRIMKDHEKRNAANKLVSLRKAVSLSS